MIVRVLPPLDEVVSRGGVVARAEARVRLPRPADLIRPALPLNKDERLL